MFSVNEKRVIASMIEKILLDLDHPEMPKEKPKFTLHVEGKEDWSWADIKPNWQVGDVTNCNPWNEIARSVMKKKLP